MATPFDSSASSSTGGKSFWQRPEGTTGKVGVIALAGAGVFGLSLILPWLISLFTNLLLLIGVIGAVLVSGVALWVLASVIFSKKTRLLYKILCRKVTGFFINLDPIAVMEEYTKGELPKKLAQVDANMSKLKAEDLRLNKEINDNSHNIDVEQRRVEEATRMITAKRADLERLQERYNNGDEDVADTDIFAMQNEIAEIESAQRLALAQIGRLQTSNETLGPLKTDMLRIYEVLRKIQQVAKFTLQDLINEVANAKRQRKATEAAHGAMSGAMSILSGKGDVSYEMFIEAREYNVDHMAQLAGETIHMMEEATTFVNSAALTQGANVGKGWDVIRQIEEKANKALQRKGIKAETVMRIEAPKGDVLPMPSTMKVPMTIPAEGGNSTSGEKYAL